MKLFSFIILTSLSLFSNRGIARDIFSDMIRMNKEAIFDAAGPGLTRARIKQLAAKPQQRCTTQTTPQDCRTELDYAKNNGLMSVYAYKWGLDNGFYPVINRQNQIGAVCRCGCFAEDTKILVVNANTLQEVPVQTLTSRSSAITLTPQASLDALSFRQNRIQSVVSGNEGKPLYAMQLSNGRTLRLTAHHGVLLNNGKMVTASDVKVGDAFVAYDSDEPAVITAVTRETNTKPVYNFETSGNNATDHIIVAEGVLVGDLVWQNQRANELYQIILRQ